jgi:hypothetical protein
LLLLNQCLLKIIFKQALFIAKHISHGEIPQRVLHQMQIGNVSITILAKINLQSKFVKKRVDLHMPLC